MKYRVKTTRSFGKHLKLCVKRGLDIHALIAVVDILQDGGKLPPKYRQHKLSGKYQGKWECHIQPDWLLIWEEDNDQLVLILVDTGTHSDLFK